MNTPIRSYKDLLVWQRAKELTVALYELTEDFPAHEQFGMTQQMRKAAFSIASNIAEGRHRGSRKDFVKFLRIAYASGAELEAQVDIAKHLTQTRALDYTKTDDLLNQTMRMLNTMLQKLKARS